MDAHRYVGVRLVIHPVTNLYSIIYSLGPPGYQYIVALTTLKLIDMKGLYRYFLRSSELGSK